ncbi:MAG: protease complex subunit PrcB family protein [Spirochaeta sp.]
MNHILPGLLAAAITVLVLMANCASEPESVPEVRAEPPQKCMNEVCVISSTNEPGQRFRSTVQVQSRSAWEDLNSSLRGNALEQYEAYLSHQLDFDEAAVVAVFAGERPTGGYQLHLERVIRTPSSISLHIRESKPDPGDMVTQALTYPSLIMVVHDAPQDIDVNFSR